VPPWQALAPTPPKPQGPPALSVEWIKENLEKYKVFAIDNPTPENVAAFMYLQRVMLDKSQRFAEQVKHVVQLDPYLDQGTRRPIATYGGTEFSKERTAQGRLLSQIETSAKVS
jgi:conjugal transfer pilus assembly protein TraF